MSVLVENLNSSYFIKLYSYAVLWNVEDVLHTKLFLPGQTCEVVHSDLLPATINLANWLIFLTINTKLFFFNSGEGEVNLVTGSKSLWWVGIGQRPFLNVSSDRDFWMRSRNMKNVNMTSINCALNVNGMMSVHLWFAWNLHQTS